MSFNLEQLPHQQAAIDAVIAALRGCWDFNETAERDYKYVFANPLIKPKHNVLQQAKLPESQGGKGIDVKMETGTGKTYVYTRLMHELQRQFGLNKFVLFVPSLAIKEGVKSFITADYTRQHFAMQDMYAGARIDLNTINAGDFSTKKGRQTMASGLVDYLEGSRNETGTIKCLLMNDAMLTSKSLTRDDYDQTLIGSTSCPVEGIKNTRPIVIIDEPHRFKKDGKAWQAIQALDPQLIIRFGATFPEIAIGKGKNKITKKDYENLVYNLGSVQAFNDGLVKGVNVYYPEIGDEVARDIAQYKVSEIISRGKEKCVRFKQVGTEKYHEVRINENLSVIDETFEGDIELAQIKNAENAVLSNDQTISKGMTLTPQVYSSSYQELVISQAIDKHFERERENWFRENAGMNAPRIKTLSLFFIDSITSYRDDDGWLKNIFEKLLREKLHALISVETDTTYKAFLEASLADIDALHAGYFAEDRGSGDVALQQEVDDILRGKERLTRFVDDDGKWITRRFLFSKWTLREGWDNPNVFVITKLRTSGSEISKLQEVGRGLRLPVDETGMRLSREQFMLDYIIDWSERDFAKRLVSEINSDMINLEKMTDEIYKLLVKADYGADEDDVHIKLLTAKIIDRNNQVIDQDALLALLPSDSNMKLQENKVTSNDNGKRTKIKLRHNNWQKIEHIWRDITRRYMLELDDIADDELQKLAIQAVRDCEMREASMSIRRDALVNAGDQLQVNDTHHDSVSTNIGVISYGEFIKQLAKRTSVPIAMWHKACVDVLPVKPARMVFNTTNAAKIVENYRQIFEQTFAGKYHYSSLDYTAKTTIMSGDEFVSELEQGLVGTNIASDVAAEERYLYDTPAYDTSIEHEVLKITPPNNVIAYGKLPRRSIKVPTYTGGTTTPDFIYAVQKDGGVEVNLLVETKANDIRMSEKAAIESQSKLLGNIRNVQWRKVVHSDELGAILREL